jgi:hypothetical protein
MGDAQCGDQSLGHCTLDSVICLFAMGAEFHCTHAKHRPREKPYLFHIEWRQCGNESSIRVECPHDRLQLVVSTHMCCGHFFVGRMPPQDPRAAPCSSQIPPFVLITRTRPHILCA